MSLFCTSSWKIIFQDINSRFSMMFLWCFTDTILFSFVWRKVKVKLLSRVRLLATPWTAAYQAPPSMGFSRQEYWSGVPLPSPSIYLPIYNPVNLSDFFFVKCTWSESNEVIIKFWVVFAWYSYFCHFTSNFSISLCFICIL